jgi:hypothetical protein
MRPGGTRARGAERAFAQLPAVTGRSSARVWSWCDLPDPSTKSHDGSVLDRRTSLRQCASSGWLANVARGVIHVNERS